MPYKNPDDRKANQQKDRRENPEKYRERIRRWRQNNPEKDKVLRQRERETLYADPERHEQYKERSRVYNRTLRQRALDTYGGSCQCCGENTYEFLSFDHINGLGTSTRMSQNKLVIWLLKEYRAEIQVLCHNCNMAKGFYGKCPHNDR